MTLVRFNPTREFEGTVPRTFSQLVDSFFDEALQTRRPFEGNFVPKMDIIETDKNFEVMVSLPGLKKEDISIDLDDRVLTVSGERKAQEERKDAKYHLIEAHYGSFSRTVTLPDNVNRESVQATFVDGILKIMIEKDEKAVKKSIQIK